MITFKINSSLNNKLVKLANKFATVYADTLNYSDTIKKSIHKYSAISMVGASTRIENAVLTDSEIQWIDTVLSQDGKPTSFKKNQALIKNKFTKDRERSIEKVAGCREMLRLIYQESRDTRPITESFIRGLHYELMKYYSIGNNLIGKYKTQSNSVVESNKGNNSTRYVFRTADAGPITESAMNDLVKWYNKAYLVEPRSIALACEFTFRFLAIHPFQDGNGRLGRGLFLSMLLQSNDITIYSLAPYLAIDRQIEQNKSEYYYILNKCSDGEYRNKPSDYKIEYFTNYMATILNTALDDIGTYKLRVDNYNLLSESSQIVLQSFKDFPELRLSSKQLVEITKLPRRTVTYCLSSLTKQCFIQRIGQGAGVRYQLIF